MESIGPEVAMSSYIQPDQPAPYPPGAGMPAPPAYLQGGPVGFGEAIQQAFRNGFVYRGRASRSAYWWFFLFQVIAEIVLELIIFIPLAAINNSGVTAVGALVLGIAFLYLALVGLALLVRRLHDTDKSGWWVLIALVPFVGPIILLVFTVLEGTPGPNRYQIS
jgi:uncharacterized membrane protein YhaH (DUF805 family)